MPLFAQVTTTINATGTTGSFNTGSVSSSGTKNDGNITDIRTSANRGWAVFDLSVIPNGSVITSANVIFTTYSSTSSSATNTVRGIMDEPLNTAGATLYTNIGNGVTMNSSSWTANGLNTKAVTAAGITFLQNGMGDNVTIGFVRGSTNQYNLYGYPGTATQQPKLQITYTPPPACTGAPNAGAIVGPPFGCPGEVLVMTLNGSSAASNLTYQWQSRPAGSGTFTNIAGATKIKYTTTITASTDYRCVVTCTNSGQTSITATHTIIAGTYYTCYCKNGIGGGTTASIDSVSIEGTTLDNYTPGTASGFYTQYPATGNTTANLQRGGLYTLHVKYGSSAKGSAWLDVNQNGIFESGEWIQINSSGTEAAITVQIPPNTPVGLTGLRIRSTDAGAINGASNPCTNQSSGETEDYVVNITPAPVNDIQVFKLLQPLNEAGVCPFIDIPVKAVIYNNGTASQSNFPIAVNLVGANGGVTNYQYTGTLPSFTTDTVDLTVYNFQLVSAYTLQAYSMLNGDANNANDSSLRIHFNVKFAANSPQPINDSVCVGETTFIGVTGDTLEHKWYDNPQGTGSPVYVGDTMFFNNATTSQYFYVSSQAPYTPPAVGSLSTTSSAGNGCGGGAMFDITPNVDLNVVSFEALFSSTGSQSVTVHYRQGTFAGNETNSGAWTTLGTATVNVTSTTALTPFTVNTQLPMIAGNVYGIYVEYNAQYTNGSSAFSNADMTIQTGTGLCSSFGGTNAGRMFNGTVVYTTGSGIKTCESPLTPVKLDVGNPPVVNLGADIQACEDLPIVLDAGNAGGSYVWSTGNTSQTVDVTGKAGKYWVEVDKYCVGSDTITIQLDPLPKMSGINFVKIGQGYQYSVANLLYADRVLWMFGDGSTDTAKSPYHTYATSGSYVVTLIAYNQCGTDTMQIMIPLGVNEIGNDKSISMYPNPASNKLYLDAMGDVKLTDVTIINVMGSVVHRQELPNSNTVQQIDISQLPAGNYNVRLNTNSGLVNKKLVIVR